MSAIEMSHFAKTILDSKYAHTKPSGRKEEWNEIIDRVVDSVVKPYLPHLVDKIKKMMLDRKFIPGGRYLWASGRPYHQINNCLLLSIDEDSREGWADLMRRITNGLMTGAGIGISYSNLRAEGALVKGMGGTSTGPISLMQMVNESGRHIMNGGSRRAALFGSLIWSHPDIEKFITVKDWPEWLKDRKSKEFNTPAPLDMTNISAALDDEFFVAYDDKAHFKHKLAHSVYWNTIRHMLETAEPGLSIDVGTNAGENKRNAPVVGSTRVLTDEGYKTVLELVDKPATVWTGVQWAKDVVFKKTMTNAPTVEVKMSHGLSIRCEPNHEFIYLAPMGVKPGFYHYRVKAKDLTAGTLLWDDMPDQPDNRPLSDYKKRVINVTESTNEDVYCCDVQVPEHSFMAEGVLISNCTELTSADDNDVCNIGSLNLARISSKTELEEIVYLSTAFLLCGTIYSVLPYKEIYAIREKNRRLGLGFMGLHEWLLNRGYNYGPNDELASWLSIFAKSTELAHGLCDKLGLSRSVKTRAIAPTGTISIIGETTSGIEPIFAVAQKRRYLSQDHNRAWKYQYIIDATANRIIDNGVDPDLIEDAYDLAEDYERRIAMQAWVQQYVDHGISSCLAAGDSYILTNLGLLDISELAGKVVEKQFADLERPTYSYNQAGDEALITQGFNNGLAKTITITLQNGYKLKCTPEHKITVLGKDYGFVWKQAKDLSHDDFVVGRAGLNYFGSGRTISTILGDHFNYEKSTNSKTEVSKPTSLGLELARFLGYMCSDGSVGPNGISLCQQKNNVCYDFSYLVGSLFNIKTYSCEDKRCKDLFNISANSREIASFCRWLGITNHDEIEVPRCIRSGGRGIVKEFIRGATLDGYVSDKVIGIATSVSYKYLMQLQLLLQNMGITCCLYKSSDAGHRNFPSGRSYKTKDNYGLVAVGKQASKFVDMIGFAEERKQKECKTKFKRTAKLTATLDGYLPDLGIRERFRKEVLPKIKSAEFYNYFSGMYKHRGMGISRENLVKMVDMGLEIDNKLIDKTYTFNKVKSIHHNNELVQTYDLSVPDGNSYIANGLVVHNTINLPAWGSSINNEFTVKSFGNTLMKYLPKLRGITCYPDGCRGGQPLNRVSYRTAIKHLGKEFVENGEEQQVKLEEFGNERACVNGVCGL